MPESALGPWDWAFVVWFLAVTTGVGLSYARRAGRSLSDYFLSARNLPWWALGTSMVATTFAADTPLVVTGFVIERGIAGNWIWWNFIFGSTLTIFIFSRWWRRSGVLTEIELIALRYDGPAARALRGFKAVYFALIVNSIVFGWVTVAMSRVLEAALGFAPGSPAGYYAIGALVTLTLVYSILSGLWGVVATDILQFSTAMIGAVILAVLSVSEAGGLAELAGRAAELRARNGSELLALFPTGWNAFTLAVLVLVLVNWWAVYYPGSEPGGGGYIAQRMFSARDERHARAGTLWFAIAHYVIRPWPWILVALAAAVLEPDILEPGSPLPAEGAYPSMFRVLPVGLLGLVVASFIAAYMSTITTMLNLSASYLVNDLYLPFLDPRAAREGGGERRKVLVSRLAVLLVTLTGTGTALLLEGAGEGWLLVMEVSAGSGLVLILRWLWWRVNAWSEISALLASAAAFLALQTPWANELLESIGRRLVPSPGSDAAAGAQDVVADVADVVAPLRLFAIILATTAVWLAVTLLTPPVSPARLESFYRRIRPGGLWGPVARTTGVRAPSLARDALLWVASSALVLGALLGVGSALLLDPARAVAFLSLAAVGGAAVAFLMRREGGGR